MNSKLQELIDNTNLCTEEYGSGKAKLTEVTREDLVEMLTELRAYEYPETGHAVADHLLLSYINDEEIKNLFIKLTRWYE